jgi:hypothetical protein
MSFALGFLWLLLALAVAVLASHRGRSGIGWFFLSLIVSPLLGFLFVHFAMRLEQPATTPYVGCGPALEPHPADLRACPHCAERIRTIAKLCRHCGSVVEPLEAPEPVGRATYKNLAYAVQEDQSIRAVFGGYRYWWPSIRSFRAWVDERGIRGAQDRGTAERRCVT